MSRNGRSSAIRSRSFPRVSGDEPADHKQLEALTEFSPRERG